MSEYTPKDEQKILKHLSLIDMDRAILAISKIDCVDDQDIKESLFRDALISYSKPFSENFGFHHARGFKISEKGIPTEMKAVHREIIDLRNRVFAHIDITYQKPMLGPGSSFSITGYEKIYTQHLVDPIQRLAKSVKKHLLTELM